MLLFLDDDDDDDDLNDDDLGDNLDGLSCIFFSFCDAFNLFNDVVVASPVVVVVIVVVVVFVFNEVVPFIIVIVPSWSEKIFVMLLPPINWMNIPYDTIKNNRITITLLHLV